MAEMSPRDRVIAAFEHRQPDKCPWNISFTQTMWSKMKEHLGDAFPGCLDNHFTEFSHEPASTWTEVKPDFWADEFGVVWDRTVDKDIGVTTEPVIREATAKALDAYEFPDIDGPRWDGFEEWAKSDLHLFHMCDLGFSLYERAWTLRGMTNLLMDMIEHPEFVDDLLDRICEWNLQIVDRFLEAGVDCIHFGDDWGQQHGLLMGPELWRRFIKPRQARMYGKVRDAGKFTSQHSCGDVKEIFPDLIEIGLCCFNPFQPEVMDVYEMKRLYGESLAFYGGISIQQTLPYGTPQEVTEAARRMMAEVGKEGGYILSPAHATPGDVPVENMVALIEAVHQQ